MRPRFFLVLFLALSFVWFGLPAVGHGSTIRVPQDKPTIQAAINSAAVNDTVLVAPGVYSENVVVNKTVNLVGSSKTSTVIDGGMKKIAVMVNASNVRVSGFTIQDSNRTGYGVMVNAVKGANITGNIISTAGTGSGVFLSRANGTLVVGNVFTNDQYAINATGSARLRILNNQALVNVTVGIQLADTNSSLVFGNSFLNEQEGMDLLNAYRNNITRNVFRAMVYRGVSLQQSHNNTVNENTFQRNTRGIDLQGATFNAFYHNDFFLSFSKHVNLVSAADANNQWDNRSLGGVVRGGNYWDDYKGTDGDGDGIGDTAYPIGFGAVDGYPLMIPFSPEPVVIRSLGASVVQGVAPLVVNFAPRVDGTLKPLNYLWDFGDGSVGGSGATASHTFALGNYTVSLTVTDTAGNVDSGTVTVIATPAGVSYVIVLVVAAAGVGALAGLWWWKRRKRMLKEAAVAAKAKKR